MKNCLVREYKYSLLITNLPNNMKEDKVVEIAKRSLKNLISQSYTMSAHKYIVNPVLFHNDLEETYCADNKKKYDARNIDFKIDYNEVKNDDRFKYIFK